MKQINKKHGSEIVFEGLKTYEGGNKIPFTSLTLNRITYGGLPRGKLIEFAGAEGASKTTLALDVCKNASKIIDSEGKNQKILFVDTENTLLDEWAELNFPNYKDYMLVVQPQEQTAEEVFQIIMDLVATGEIMLVVLDSIAVMFSENEQANEMSKSMVAGISKQLSAFSKFMVQMCKQHNTTLIGINQLRDNIGSMFGGTVTTGGRAWKHNCTVRLQLQRNKLFDENRKELSLNAEKPFGHTVKAHLAKTKAFPPDRKLGIYTLVYTKGIDVMADAITAGKDPDVGAISQSGAWYELVDLETGEILPNTKVHGEGALRKLLIQDPALYEKFYNQVYDKVSESVNYKADEYL